MADDATETAIAEGDACVATRLSNGWIDLSTCGCVTCWEMRDEAQAEADDL